MVEVNEGVNEGVNDMVGVNDGVETPTTGLGVVGRNDKVEGENETPEPDEFTKEYLGKPETGYDYNSVELPEGMNLDEDMTKEFNTLAEKYNMSNKGASEFMSMAVKNASKIQQAVIQQEIASINQRIEAQEKAILNDKEIGGKNYEEAKRLANLAYSEFVQKDKDAHQLLCRYGLNNHPTLYKMFYEIGKQMEDAKIHQAGSPSVKDKTPAEKLFGES